MKQRLHPIELTLMIVAALALTSGAVALHTQSQLAEKVVRLHVLANSDSEEDQALKLKVRDAVLEQATETLRGADSQAEASRRLTDILPELEETARVVITALRVLIGEAAGQNWWCVVFPPLCTAAASDVPTVALDAGLTDQEVALITEADEGYILKFKSVELWQTLKAKLTK